MRSPFVFRAPRASRTLCLAEGLCLGQGVEEQKRRVLRRHRAWNIARSSSEPALIPAGSDPACGHPPLSAAPLSATPLIPGHNPVLKRSKSKAPWLLPFLQELQLYPLRTALLPSPGRGGTETTHSATQTEGKAPATGSRDGTHSRVVSKCTP